MFFIHFITHTHTSIHSYYLLRCGACNGIHSVSPHRRRRIEEASNHNTHSRRRVVSRGSRRNRVNGRFTSENSRNVGTYSQQERIRRNMQLFMMLTNLQSRNGGLASGALRAMLGGGRSTNGAWQMNIDNMSYDQMASIFGKPVKTADADDVAALPVLKLKSEDVKRLPHDANSCVICLDNFKVGSEMITLPCLHRFDKSCIKQWLNTANTCPICKHEISP